MALQAVCSRRLAALQSSALTALLLRFDTQVGRRVLSVGLARCGGAWAPQLFATANEEAVVLATHALHALASFLLHVQGAGGRYVPPPGASPAAPRGPGVAAGSGGPGVAAGSGGRGARAVDLAAASVASLCAWAATLPVDPPGPGPWDAALVRALHAVVPRARDAVAAASACPPLLPCFLCGGALGPVAASAAAAGGGAARAHPLRAVCPKGHVVALCSVSRLPCGDGSFSCRACGALVAPWVLGAGAPWLASGTGAVLNPHPFVTTCGRCGFFVAQ